MSCATSVAQLTFHPDHSVRANYSLGLDCSNQAKLGFEKLGDDVANRYPHLRVVLEPIDSLHTLLGFIGPWDRDACVAEDGLVLVQLVRKGRVHERNRNLEKEWLAAA